LHGLPCRHHGLGRAVGNRLPRHQAFGVELARALMTRRRELLLGTTAAVATTGSLPAPAIAQHIKEFTMVTSWTQRGMSGLQTGAERLAQSIAALSDGRLKVTVYPSGRLVRPFEVFDAVAANVADMYHSDDYYFDSKSPALSFFSAVPYGLTAD